MADVHSKAVRSYNMSRIRGKNTKPEILVRKYLFSKGLRYRLHAKLPGKPDLILPRYKVAVFVHGCFWHGHAGCKYFVVPKTRSAWWIKKINGNQINDNKKITALEEQGWRVITVWECSLKKDRMNDTLAQLLHSIQNGDKL